MAWKKKADAISSIIHWSLVLGRTVTGNSRIVAYQLPRLCFLLALFPPLVPTETIVYLAQPTPTLRDGLRASRTPHADDVHLYLDLYGLICLDMFA